VMVDGEQIYGDGVNVAARESRRPRRHLHLRYRPCANQEQAAAELRGLRRATGQEHRTTGAGCFG
jgi:hypothetical protein